MLKSMAIFKNGVENNAVDRGPITLVRIRTVGMKQILFSLPINPAVVFPNN